MNRPLTKYEVCFGKIPNDQELPVKMHNKSVWNHIIGNTENTMIYDCLPLRSQQRKNFLYTLVSLSCKFFEHKKHNTSKQEFEYIRDSQTLIEELRRRFDRNMQKKDFQLLREQCDVSGIKKYLLQRSASMTENVVSDSFHSLHEILSNSSGTNIETETTLQTSLSVAKIEKTGCSTTTSTSTSTSTRTSTSTSSSTSTSASITTTPNTNADTNPNIIHPAPLADNSKATEDDDEQEHDEEINEKEKNIQEEISIQKLTEAVDKLQKKEVLASNLAKAPENIIFSIWNWSLDMHFMDLQRVVVSNQAMKHLGKTLRDHHYQIQPMCDISSKTVESINKIATTLHDNCKLTMRGPPTAVKCASHDMHWGKRVHLKMFNSWQGMSLGLFNKQTAIVLWARDAPKAIELADISKLAFSIEDDVPRRSRKRVKYY